MTLIAHGIDGSVLALPLLAAIAICTPGLLRDIRTHFSRKDQP